MLGVVRAGEEAAVTAATTQETNDKDASPE
jgi:hypothetical protein